MHIIVARMQARPGRLAELRQVLDSMIAPSRAEAGCLEYGYWLSSEDDSSVLFFERWKDQAAVDFHFATEHFLGLGGKLDGLLEGEPQISIFDAALLPA